MKGKIQQKCIPQFLKMFIWGMDIGYWTLKPVSCFWFLVSGFSLSRVYNFSCITTYEAIGHWTLDIGHYTLKRPIFDSCQTSSDTVLIR